MRQGCTRCVNWRIGLYFLCRYIVQIRAGKNELHAQIWLWRWYAQCWKILSIFRCYKLEYSCFHLPLLLVLRLLLSAPLFNLSSIKLLPIIHIFHLPHIDDGWQLMDGYWVANHGCASIWAACVCL